MADSPDISPASTMDMSDTASDTNQPTTGADAQTPPTQQGPSQPPAPQGQPPQAQQPQQPGQPSQQDNGLQTQNGVDDKMQEQKPQPSNIVKTQQQAQLDHAGHFYKVAEALAGGPRFKTTIDPNTGIATRTKVPLSRGDLGMAIAMEALSGAVSGLAQRGPGAEGRAAAAGFAQVSEQQQQAQQQQEQQASADYTRHAAALEANMRMMQVAQTIGSKDFETNQQSAAQYKDLFAQVQKEQPDAIKHIGNEQDALKFHWTQDTAMPTGNVVPVYDDKTGKQKVGPAGNKLWELEYAYMDPNIKGDKFLSDDDKAMAAKYRLPGFADSDGKPSNLPDSLPMRLSMALNYKHRITSLKLGEQSLEDYWSGDKNAPNLIDKVQSDPSIIDSFEKFQPLLAATEGDIGKAIGEMAAGGQGRQPDPNGAGKILNLYGGTPKVKAHDQDVADAKEKAKKVADKRAAYDGALNTQTAESIVADKDATSDQKKRAQDFLAADRTRDISTATAKAGAEARARTQGEIDVKKANGIPLSGEGNKGTMTDMVKDPKLAAIQSDPNEKPVNGVRQGYLDKIKEQNPNFASELEAIHDGRMTMGDYALAKNDGQMLAAYLTRAFPDYDQSKTQAYKKTRDSFTTGKDSKQIEAGNTTMLHVARLFENAGSFKASIPGTQQYTDLHMDIPQVVEELNSAYTDGVLHEEKRAELESKLGSAVPSIRLEGAREAMRLLSDKVQQKQRSWQRAKPSKAVADYPVMSDEARQAFKSVLGKDMDEHGNIAAPQQAYVPPAGSMRKGDGKGGYIYKLPNGSVVDNTGAPVQQQ